MPRTIFFWIAAILSTLFGALMFLAPGFAAQSFALTASSATDVVFRILGATLLSVGLMNFLVRNEPDSSALRAVLVTDVSIHLIGAVADIWSVAGGELSLASSIPGFVSHAIVGLGALWFLMQRPMPAHA